MTLRAIFVFALLTLQLWSVGAAAQEQDLVAYRMRAGDNLYTLAQQHFTRPTDYVVVQRLNRIANPYRIPVARTVRIPRRLLRYDRLTARVTSFRGTVRLIDGARDSQASLGATVGEGQEIVTGANSFLTLRMPDQSVVTLPSQSRVAVDRLRRWSLTGAVERQFRLVRGRARAIVTPMERENDEFRFSTPVAVSAVRGTEFRVSFDDERGRATTEVLEGQVAVFTADEAGALTSAGFGTVTSAAGAETFKLLPAPKLTEPGRVQDGQELRFDIVPMPQANAYRVQVAQDAGFLDVISESRGSEAGVNLPPIADGIWFVRISAIDANGLEGIPETYSFERRLNRITASVDEQASGRYRQYLFRWEVEGEGERQFRFQLSRADDKGTPLIDEPGLTGRSFVVTDLPAGTYNWRVQTLQFVGGKVHGKWSPVERLTITASR